MEGKKGKVIETERKRKRRKRKFERGTGIYDTLTFHRG